MFALATIGCASGPGGRGAYDPDATETLGRAVAREDTGITTRQSNPTTLLPVGGLLLPVAMYPSGPAMRIFAHRVALEDGHEFVVYIWYPDHGVGGCNKLFESRSGRKDYPRMINANGCRNHQRRQDSVARPVFTEEKSWYAVPACAAQ